MKKYMLLAGVLVAMVACNNAPKEDKETKTETTAAGAEQAQFFGEKISEEGAVPVSELSNLLRDTNAVNTKLQGTVSAVCQTKGCWMTLKNPNGEDIRITFKDYAFFVPKDCSGKTAIVEGIAKIETTSVADLKEYAKDDKKSQAEIDAITEPLNETVFEAKGVMLK